MFLNCMREEKFPKDKEGEILEQIAWGDSQIFITGEFLKQICKVCPVMTEWTSIQVLSSVLLCTQLTEEQFCSPEVWQLNRIKDLWSDKEH